MHSSRICTAHFLNVSRSIQCILWGGLPPLGYKPPWSCDLWYMLGSQPPVDKHPFAGGKNRKNTIDYLPDRLKLGPCPGSRSDIFHLLPGTRSALPLQPTQTLGSPHHRTERLQSPLPRPRPTSGRPVCYPAGCSQPRGWKTVQWRLPVPRDCLV